MAEKLAERKEKIHQAMMGNSSNIKPVSNDRVVTDEALFGQLGRKIKRVK